jgi:hypothetical protein
MCNITICCSGIDMVLLSELSEFEITKSNAAAPKKTVPPRKSAKELHEMVRSRNKGF